MEVLSNLPTIAAQITNWLILAAIVGVSICFVGRDTRRRELSWPETVAWTLISIITFPIGFGLYYLVRGRISRKYKARGEA